MDKALEERLDYLDKQLETARAVIKFIKDGDFQLEALSDQLSKLNYGLELMAASGDLNFEVIGHGYVELANTMVEDGYFEHQSFRLITDMAKGVNFK